MRAKLVVGESQLRAGKPSPSSMQRAHEARARARTRPLVSDFESRRSPPRAALGGMAEPYATPSNNLALALEANEQIRMLFKSKSHRGDPCRHLVRRGHADRDGRGRVRGARPAADAAAHCRLQGGLPRRPGRPLTPSAAPPRRRARHRGHHAHRVRRLARAPARAARPLCARGSARDRPSAPLRSSRSSAAARRARASSTTSPTPSRPGTSTRASPRPSASLWATSTCASSCNLAFQGLPRRARATCHAPSRRRRGAACYGAANALSSQRITDSTHTHLHTHLTHRRCWLRHRHLGRHRHPRLVGDGGQTVRV